MATYCISDMHGDSQKYYKFKELLKDEDEYYVLGDAIDRGEDGIAILLDIMGDPRAKMLMGNHEYMMLNYLKSHNFEDRVLWCGYNGGQVTLENYRELTAEQRQNIYNFLLNLPIVITLNLNERQFYLVHSCPVEDINETCLYQKATEQQIYQAVWKRITCNDYNAKINKIIVDGHTYVQHYGTNKIVFDGDTIEQSHFIDIDGGCAIQDECSHLIVLKLDDLSVQYMK